MALHNPPHNPPHPATLSVEDGQHQVCRSVEQRVGVHKQLRKAQIGLPKLAWSLFHVKHCQIKCDDKLKVHPCAGGGYYARQCRQSVGA